MFPGLLIVLAVISILSLFVYFLEKGINKLFGITKLKISETPAKNADRWGRGIIAVIALGTLPFVITKDVHIMKWFWILYFSLSAGFQSFLEWKYLRESKQYISTIIFLILIVAFMYNIEHIIYWG